jgi:hypothetical protein
VHIACLSEWAACSHPIPILCRPLTFPSFLPLSKDFQSGSTLLSILLRQLPGWFINATSCICHMVEERVFQVF